MPSVVTLATTQPKFRYAEWGTRFASLSLDDTPVSTPARPPVTQARERELAT